MKNSSSDNRTVPREQTDRQTDMWAEGQRDKSKPIITLRNYANVSKNS
jgi:hypothetical protein